MNIHEYQAKALLRRYGIASPEGRIAESAEAAAEATRALGGGSWVVKAQIHAGGRGKAGGVRKVGGPRAAETAAEKLLGTRLITYQTGPEGKPVRRVYVEQGCAAVRELYLAALVDRTHGAVALLASAEGGEDIEQTAARSPEKIHRALLGWETGIAAEDATRLAKALGLDGKQAAAFKDLLKAVAKAFLETDASLIEINPLGVTAEGDLVALDVKMSFDDNALFRHPDIAELRDRDEVDPSDLEAACYEINYVKLDGDIGCMVNGAGLALATLDAIKDQGGAPADFMDVRPVATRQQIEAGFRMLLGNAAVRAILVNVYGGGILRCDSMAEGIASAVQRDGLKVPLIVRAAGTNNEICRKVLRSRGVPVTFARDIDEAARLAARAVKREAA